MSKSRPGPGFQRLLVIADGLDFKSHQIAHLLDAQGRHMLKLPGAFPFGITLFHFREGAVTRHLTWHERLELLIPLDGPLRERMGDQVVDLYPGDLLVVDHIKPHQVVDTPGLNTRAIVVTFLQECVFTPGGPLADHAFLLPFFRKVEGRPQLVSAASARAGEVHEALARLLACYFNRRSVHREAGCKAWLLVLLHVLIQQFQDSALERVELLRRQQQVARLKPVFDHVREHYAGKLSVGAGARLCGMSKAVFGRVFKEATGMTWGNYLNHIRMTHAVELLQETHDSIAEISLRLGYSDQSHFCRHFHRTFDCAPGQYRIGLARRR
jgi:AraC-like DNA-binding protein/mannose-6-phosphate isomerase-like protein (cupin superfamily)